MHDNEYGNCICPKCAEIEGENKLGKILMRVRTELREKEEKKKHIEEAKRREQELKEQENGEDETST